MPSESIFILIVVEVAGVAVAMFDIVSDGGGIFVDVDDADEDENGTGTFPLIFVLPLWLLFWYKSCLSNAKEYLRRVGSTPVR